MFPIPPDYIPSERYKATPSTSGGRFSRIKVVVVDEQENEVVAEYVRNYSCLMKTFHPFRHLCGDNEWRDYALIASQYWQTSVLDLSTGTIIANESGHPFDDEDRAKMKDAGVNPEVVEKTKDKFDPTWGFCPMDFRVFDYNEFYDKDFVPDSMDESLLSGKWGLVSGCVWGDDSSMKLRYVDLSRVEEGIVHVDDRFGYVEMGSDLSDLEFYTETGRFAAPIQAVFEIGSGKGKIYSKFFE